jgi:hypothetical protein
MMGARTGSPITRRIGDYRTPPIMDLQATARLNAPAPRHGDTP